MANVLETIVEFKKQELIERKKALPLEEFIHQLTPSTKSLYTALGEETTGFIFECKKASPSKGLIREHFDLDEILHAYTPYASAISVLTDEKYFQGHYNYLKYVATQVTQPVINKDFFIEPYQVHLARYYHADAILLMLSVLSDDEYEELAQLAQSYQLDVLTEVSNQEEAQRAVKLGAKIIGINNRNLRDLSTDLAATEALAPYLTALSPNARIISESGIYTHQDVLRLSPLCDGFLVGSSLMAQSNLEVAVKELVFGATKICGITSVNDALAVTSSGASWMGLIFAKKSKRCITLATAKEIVNQVPFRYVAVVIDKPISDLLTLVDTLDLSAVQLHGSEDQAYIDQLRQSLPEHCQIWKAIGVGDTMPDISYTNVDLVLFDCKVGEQSGGTGQQFDWRRLSDMEMPTNFAIAGGLNPQNAQQAIQFKPSMLDVNSGVESSPGIKDHQLLTQLFLGLRNY
jgi:indole-3-glycerol phosphate synthase/phosphoribosylanthranilate isomerase